MSESSQSKTHTYPSLVPEYILVASGLHATLNARPENKTIPKIV